MRDWIQAVFISLALHGILSVGVAACLVRSDGASELPRLDVTSVDLSFSETPDETAVPVAAPPAEPLPELPPPVRDPAPPQPDVPDELPDPFNPDSFVVPEACRPNESPEELPPEPVPEEKLAQQTEPVPTPEPVPSAESARPSESAPTPSVAAPRQARIDAPARQKTRIKPKYPDESRKRGERGDVTVEIAITAQGTVETVRIVRSSGFPLLDAAAEKTVREAKFEPAKSGGRPVASVATLTLNFRLH